MSLNVMKEFISFKKKSFNNYAKLCLDKYYDKTSFNKLLDLYIKIRYYDELDIMKDKSLVKKISNHLVENAKINITDKNKNSIKHTLYFFGFIYHLDGLMNNSNCETIAKRINEYRTNELKLNKLDDKKLANLFENDLKRINNYLQEFNDNNFYINKTKISNNLYNINLLHNINFPKLYSKYAIDNVYNRNIVLENKIFIEYYMVSATIINDIIKLKFNNNYLVDFSQTFFTKKEKMARLINIINDEIIKEKIIIKINYSTYIDNKTIIDTLINKGFKFALIIDKEINKEDKIMLKIFSYVLNNKLEVEVV